MNDLAFWKSELYRTVIRYVRDYLVVTSEALEHIYCIINDQIISSELIKIMLKNGNNDLQLPMLVLLLNPITNPIYHDLLTIHAPDR